MAYAYPLSEYHRWPASKYMGWTAWALMAILYWSDTERLDKVRGWKTGVQRTSAAGSPTPRLSEPSLFCRPQMHFFNLKKRCGVRSGRWFAVACIGKHQRVGTIIACLLSLDTHSSSGSTTVALVYFACSCEQNGIRQNNHSVTTVPSQLRHYQRLTHLRLRLRRLGHLTRRLRLRLRRSVSRFGHGSGGDGQGQWLLCTAVMSQSFCAREILDHRRDLERPSGARQHPEF